MQKEPMTAHVSFPAHCKEDYLWSKERAVKRWQKNTSAVYVEAIQHLRASVEKHGENYQEALGDNYEPEYITELKHMIKNIKTIEPEKSSQEIANDIFEIAEGMDLEEGMIE